MISNTSYPLIPIEELFESIRNGRNVEQIDEIGKYRVTRIQTISDKTVDLEKTKWTNDDVPDDYFMEEGDILLSHINSFEHLAKSAIFSGISEKVVHGTNLIRFKPNKNKVIPEYIAAIFKSKLFIDKAKTFAQKAVNQASLRVADLKSIQIPLPPLSIQEEIAAEIEGCQKIIDGAKMVIENYKPKIDIDAKWEEEKLGDISEFKNGLNFSKESTGEKIKIIGVSHFKNNLIAPISELEEIQVNEILNDNYLLKKGDIIFVRSNGNAELVGRSMVVPEVEERISFSGFTIRCRLKDGIEPLYIGYLFKSVLHSTMMKNTSRGANIRNLSQEILNDIIIPIPPKVIQQRIVIQLEKEQALVNANKQLIEIYEQKIKDIISKIWSV